MVSAENGIAVDFVKSKVGLNPFVDGDFFALLALEMTMMIIFVVVVFLGEVDDDAFILSFDL